MDITDIKIVSAQITANVKLNEQELAQLDIKVDEASLQSLALATLAPPSAVPVAYIENDPNSLSDVVDERTAEIEAHKQRLDRHDAAKADAAWDDHKNNKI